MDNKPQFSKKFENSEKSKKILTKRKYRKPKINIGVVVLIALFALVSVICFIFATSSDNPQNQKLAESSHTSSQTESSQLSSNETVIATETVTLPNTDIHKGELILVNFDNDFVFPDTPDDISVYENKSASYQVSDTLISLSPAALEALNRATDDFYAVSGCSDVIIVSGYRTKEFQDELYKSRAETHGAEYAAKYVALPGKSEHHTGYAMDLSVYAGGQSYYIIDYEPCKWLREHFEDYGFILRYPEEKSAITGIGFESWHYRYVGTPHAEIINSLGLCLEEYIDLIETMQNGKALVFDGTAVQEVEDYEFGKYKNRDAVYYVPAENGDSTDITVPQNAEYKISGDNKSGFIITITERNGEK